MGQNLCIVFDAFSPISPTGIREIKDISILLTQFRLTIFHVSPLNIQLLKAEVIPVTRLRRARPTGTFQVDPKSRFFGTRLLLMGNGKSDMGSFADRILEKSFHLSAYRRRRLLFRQMTAIPLDLLVEALHAEAMIDPGDIVDLAEFINGFQPDIPRGELSVTYVTDGLTTLNHLRKEKIGIRPSNPWSPTSLLVLLNDLPGMWVCPNGSRLDVRTGNCICYTFQRAGLRGRQRFKLRISKRWDEIHVRIAELAPGFRKRHDAPQAPEEVERQALQSQPWRALQNWIMSSLNTRG